MSEKRLNERIGELADENDLLVRINKQLKKKNEQLAKENVRLKDDAQYYKTKSARLEEELLSTRGCMYE